METALIHERIDDIPLLIATMRRLKLAEAIDKHVQVHGNHDGMTIGNLMMVWLAHIMSQGNHAKSRVADWVKKRRHMLRMLLRQPIRVRDFSDDRLGVGLKYLSDPEVWQQIEAEIWAAMVEVYDPGIEHIRVDATTANGHHEMSEDGLMQRGHSKDHRPDLPQLKMMAASAEPCHLPLAHDVVSGEHADDPLYVPLIERVRNLLQRSGMLYVGDCKMAALHTRAWLVQQGDHYLTPLPLTGETATLMEQWIDNIVEGEQTATLIWQAGELIGAGYEFVRAMSAPGSNQATLSWSERVLVVRSLKQAHAQHQTLLAHLSKAKAALSKLAPAPARGKRPIRTEAVLQQHIQTILDQYAVHGLLHITFERLEPESGQSYYRITDIRHNQEAIEQHVHRLGWRVMVSNVPPDKLAFTPLTLIYREGWGLERLFHHLKNAPLGLSPLWVRLDHQIQGLTHLLTLGLRVLSTIEFALRESLNAANEQLSGLYPGSPNRRTSHPTASMVLKAFAQAEPTLTLTRTPTGQQAHMTSLPRHLCRVLRFLGLPLALYHRLQLS